MCSSQATCKQIKSHLTIRLYFKRENCHLVRFLTNDEAEKEQKGLLWDDLLNLTIYLLNVLVFLLLIANISSQQADNGVLKANNKKAKLISWNCLK